MGVVGDSTSEAARTFTSRHVFILSEPKGKGAGVPALSRLSHVRFFATLWTVARQALLSMGFSRQEHWSGLPCSLPEDLPNAEIQPASLMFPALADGFLNTSTTWEAHELFQMIFKIFIYGCAINKYFF